jgi:hypothetical protein
MVLHHVNHACGLLNQNTFFAGIMMLLLNVGSRYIVDEFSTDEKEYSQNILLRRICIFAVCFVGTKDVVTSLVLTAAFVILATGLFRGKPQSREGMKNMAVGGAVSTFGAMQDASPPLFAEEKKE